MSDAANIAPSFAEVGEGLSTGFGPAAAAVPSAIPSDVGGGGGGFWASLFGGGGGGGAPNLPAGFANETQAASMIPGYGGQGDVPTAPAPTSAVPVGTTAASAAQTLPGTEGWTLTPEGAQTAAQQAIAGVPATPPVGGGGGPMDWFSRNILGPYKQSGIPEVLDIGGKVAGVGIPAYSILSQLSRQQGGQTPLSPLQQEQLNALRTQQNYYQNMAQGNVPASVQQTLQLQAKNEIQKIKAKYAQLGMSGSTAEQQDIAAAQARATAGLAQYQTQMMTTGAQGLGIPVGQIGKLSEQQLRDDAAFNDALAKFVAALAGGPPQQQKPAS